MIRDTILKIESALRSAGLREETRAELLDLLGKLRAEIDGLAKTNKEGAQSVAGFAELSAHEAIRRQRNPKLLDVSLRGLSTSVEEFEESHPQLVQVVNRICTTLANLGI